MTTDLATATGAGAVRGHVSKDDEPIFAVAAGGGRSALTLVRMSGPGCGAIVECISGKLPGPRRATLRTLRDASGEILDRAIVLWFPAPGSYTGEDAAELQLHGGRAVLDAVAAALAAAGARPADPGEFTRRAFLHGRLDLLEAEAIGDLVNAETDAQRRQALRQMRGELGELYRAWADRLLGLTAHQEALIDFPDEDLPEGIAPGVAEGIDALRRDILAHLDDGRRGERVRDGLTFVISGPPNVGKSSLMNALAGREAALVSPDPGTTRDALEVRIVLAGVPVTLTDTAGLRETADRIEAAGVERAIARAREADCLIMVAAADQSAPAAPSEAARILVANKIDLRETPPWADLGVSAKTGAGLGELRRALEGIATQLTGALEAPPLTRLRHRRALERASDALLSARSAVMPELCGEELRIALAEIGTLLGRVGVEDILDAIFGEFCIGK